MSYDQFLEQHFLYDGDEPATFDWVRDASNIAWASVVSGVVSPSGWHGRYRFGIG